MHTTKKRRKYVCNQKIRAKIKHLFRVKMKLVKKDGDDAGNASTLDKSNTMKKELIKLGFFAVDQYTRVEMR